MERLKKRVDLTDDDGANMAEYGLLITFIAAILVVAVTALGVDVTALFDAAVAAFA